MSNETIVELRNIPSEYGYIERLACRKCNSPIQGERLSSSQSPDGRMHDRWEIRCDSCSHVEEIILSVPLITFSTLPTELTNGMPRVWEILSNQGRMGFVTWNGAYEFQIDLPKNMAQLMSATLEKLRNCPTEWLDTVVPDFFSLQLPKISNGACWAKEMAGPDDEPPPVPEPSFPDWDKNLEMQLFSEDRTYVYLRRFDSISPTATLVAQAVYPSRLIAVTAVGRSPLAKAVQWLDSRTFSQMHERIEWITLDHDGWLKRIVQISAESQGVIVDTHLYSKKRKGLLSGLIGEIASTAMIPIGVPRVFLARHSENLLNWIPQSLVVRLAPTEVFNRAGRTRVGGLLRRALYPEFQQQFDDVFIHMQKSYQRAMILDGPLK